MTNGQHRAGRRAEVIEIDRGGWISGPCLDIDPVESLADDIVLEVRKVLSALRRGEIDAGSARSLMRKNVGGVVLDDAS